MKKLYPFQQETVDAVFSELETNSTALVASPTGSGKTEMIINIVNTFKDLGFICTLLVDKVSLVENLYDRFLSSGILSTIYCGSLNRKEVSQVTIASVDTFKNETRHKSDVIIIDEVHNVNDSDEGSSFIKSINNTKKDTTKIIGFTATPFRASGSIHGVDRIFGSITHQIALSFLIENGFLVKPLMSATKNEFDTKNLSIKAGEWDANDIAELVNDDEKLELQVTEALEKLTGRKKVFWQAANISHAYRIAAKLTEKNESTVVVVSKNISIKKRSELLKDFEEGDIRNCVFVSILSEGYNYPPADALVLLRPVRSPVLYVQVCGRVLRTYDGKTNALILDFGRVRKTCGPLDQPILRQKGERKTVEAEVWICEECYVYNEKGETTCSNCGYEKEVKKQSTPESRTSSSSDVDEMLSGFKQKETLKGNIISISLSKYISKNNNTCIKLVYLINDGTSGLFGNTNISQYLTNAHPWAKFNSENILKHFGLPDFQSVIERLERRGSILLFANEHESKIEYSFDGKYNKVKRVMFRERLRESDTQLSI